MSFPCHAHVYKMLTRTRISFSRLMLPWSSDDNIIITMIMEKKLDISILALCDITKATVGGIYYCVNDGHWWEFNCIHHIGGGYFQPGTRRTLIPRKLTPLEPSLTILISVLAHLYVLRRICIFLNEPCVLPFAIIFQKYVKKESSFVEILHSAST